MVRLPIIDTLMYNVQRQGKLAFYVSFLRLQHSRLLDCVSQMTHVGRYGSSD